MTYKLLDNGLPKIGELCYFVRYNENEPVTGYLKDNTNVYISYTGTTERLSKFKGYKPLINSENKILSF